MYGMSFDPSLELVARNKIHYNSKVLYSKKISEIGNRETIRIEAISTDYFASKFAKFMVFNPNFISCPYIFPSLRSPLQPCTKQELKSSEEA